MLRVVINMAKMWHKLFKMPVSSAASAHVLDPPHLRHSQSLLCWDSTYPKVGAKIGSWKQHSMNYDHIQFMVAKRGTSFNSSKNYKNVSLACLN